MKKIDSQIIAREEQLMKELEGMKFSFRKIRKVIELDALLNFKG